MRIVTIDGFRGLCLLLVAYVHCHMVLGSAFGQVNHGMFLWVDTAAGFVSISGFLIGTVACGLLDRRGLPAVDGFMRKRLRILVTWHVVSVLFVVLLIATIAVLGADLGSIQQFPIAGPLLVATFVMPDHFFNVLTMYFFFLLLSPLALRLCQRSSPGMVVAASLSVWLAGQTSIDKAVMGEFTQLVGAVTGGNWERVIFPLMNWQVIFFCPFALGFALSRRPDMLTALRSDAARHVFYVCAAAFAGLVVLRTAQMNLPSSGLLSYLSEEMNTSYSKQRVAGGFLAAFAMTAYMFTYLLSQGPAEAPRPIRLVSRALQRFFSHPLLVKVGQASIYVFATNTMYVYFLKALDAERFGEAAKIALMVGAVALAFPVAWIVPILKAPRPARQGSGPAA